MFLRIIKHDLRYLNKTIIMSLAVCPGNRKIFRSFWLFSFIPSDFPLIILPTFTVQPDIAENFQSCWNHLKRKWLLLLRTSCLGTRFLPPFFPLPLSFRFAPLSLDFFAPLNLFSIFSFFSPLFPLFELCFPPSLAQLPTSRDLLSPPI